MQALNKRTLLLMSLVGLILFIGGWLLLITTVQCGSSGVSANGGASCTSTGATSIGSVLFAIGGITTFLAWFFGMIHTVRLRRWNWVAIVFLLPGLGTLAYGLVGPETSPQGTPERI